MKTKTSASKGPARLRRNGNKKPAPRRKPTAKGKPARSNDASYAFFTRLHDIVEILKDAHPHYSRRVTAKSLAKDLAVGERTIKRDIKFLKERIEAPIEWMPLDGTYKLLNPYSLPINSHDVAGLDPRPGQAMGTPLVGDPLDEISAPVAPGRQSQMNFARLCRAARDRCNVHLQYRKPDDANPGQRRLQPLHLAYLNNTWMLIAHDRDKKALRHFRIDRIVGEVHIQDEVFKYPADFDPKTYIARNLAGFGGSAAIDIVIHISPQLIPYFESNKWNETQTLTPQADGSGILRLRVNNYDGTRRKILELGALAIVQEPTDLRNRIAREIATLDTLYKTRHASPLRKIPD